MSAANNSLEEAAASVGKAQEEVAEARKEIKRYTESSASMSKRTEELVASVNSRYEALETRLRGIDLEITAFRKSVDVLDGSVRNIVVDVTEIKNHQQRFGRGLRTLYILLMIVLGTSVIGIVVNFL